MASLIPLNHSTCLKSSSRMALRLHTSSPMALKMCGEFNQFFIKVWRLKEKNEEWALANLLTNTGWLFQSNMLASKPNALPYGKTCSNISCTMNMNASQPEPHGKSTVDLVIDKARKLWDNSPQEVKSFPWITALENFTQLIIDIILVVTQYLYVPVMAITSVSEMSYCAHERKLALIPIPILISVALAGMLRNRALKLSPFLKDAKVPWHLYANMLFFTLIKLPGPYYPYWGRIFIPHFANGGLFRTLWFLFLWYRMQRKDAHTDH